MAHLTDEQCLKGRLTGILGGSEGGQRRLIMYTEDRQNLETQNSNNKACIKFMPSLMESA